MGCQSDTLFRSSLCHTSSDFFFLNILRVDLWSSDVTICFLFELERIYMYFRVLLFSNAVYGNQKKNNICKYSFHFHFFWTFIYRLIPFMLQKYNIVLFHPKVNLYQHRYQHVSSHKALWIQPKPKRSRRA